MRLRPVSAEGSSWDVGEPPGRGPDASQEWFRLEQRRHASHSRCLGLGSEPCQFGLAGEFPGANHLQRDDPVEGPVARLVNHPHAPARNDFQQVVVAEAAARDRVIIHRPFRGIGFDNG